MENASKALIIAGAILLSILLISLGIMIFNQAQDTVTNSGMSEEQVVAFNNKFVKYEGNQKGAMVKSLIQDVLASNASPNNEERQVLLNDSATPKTSNIKSNSTYNVAIEYTSGRVSSITVYVGKDNTTTKLVVT